MSTRCHILFKDENSELLTYKHTDGYPEEVLPLIKEYWRWYPRTSEIEYITASWFYYCKRKREISPVMCKYDEPMDMDEISVDHPVARGYGICPDKEIHGDTSHLYVVDIDTGSIAHYTPKEWVFDEETLSDITSRDPVDTYDVETQGIV